MQPLSADVIVCLDANFQQKRRKSKETDPPIEHPATRFLTVEAARDMEKKVELVCAKGPSKGATKPGGAPEQPEMVVPEDALDHCERSYIAAQEKVVKASKNYFSDTGLMALLCRHDRVLWLVNLTTPGERQHYAVALLAQLFLHIPKSWVVGFLYDIACQIHRSLIKVRAASLIHRTPRN